MKKQFFVLILCLAASLPLLASKELMPRRGYDYFVPVAEFREATKDLPGGSFSVFYPTAVFGYLYACADLFSQGARFVKDAEEKNKDRLFKTTAEKEKHDFLKAYKVSRNGAAKKAIDGLVNTELLVWLFGAGDGGSKGRVNRYLNLVARYVLAASSDLVVKGQGPFNEPAYKKLVMPTAEELIDIVNPVAMLEPAEGQPFLNQSLFAKLAVPSVKLHQVWRAEEVREALEKKKKKEEELRLKEEQEEAAEEAALLAQEELAEAITALAEALAVLRSDATYRE